MKKLLKFLKRVFQGEDVVLVKQSKAHWDAQFVDGKWDRLASGQRNTELLAKLVLEQRQDGTPLRVLDIGCGNGGLARLIAGESGIDYTGIDISETATHAAQEHTPTGQFRTVDAEHPPEDLGRFDVLVFNEVFFYINPDTTLPQYRSHATVGAKVFISVVRSWRTPFVFRRIRRHMHIEKYVRVADSSERWDIAVGRFI